MNLKRLSYLIIPAMFSAFSCTETKEIEELIPEEEAKYELPTINVVDLDSYIRGDYKISVEFGDYESDLIKLEQITLNNQGKQIAEGVYSEDSSQIFFDFDSKTINDGIAVMEVKATFEALEGLESTEAKLNFDVEIDNYFPAIFVAKGYASNRNTTNPDASIVISEFSSHLFLVDQNNKMISELFEASSLEGDSLIIEIPTDFEGQKFFVAEAQHYRRVDNYFDQTDKKVYNYVNLNDHHTNGAAPTYGSTGSLDKKTVTIGVSKSIPDYRMENSHPFEAVVTEDDEFTYYTYDQVYEPTDYRNYILSNTNVIYGDMYASVLTSFIDQGDTIKLTESDFTNEYLEITTKKEDADFSNLYIIGKKGGNEGAFFYLDTYTFDDLGNKIAKVRKVVNKDVEMEYVMDNRKFFDGGYTYYISSSNTLPFQYNTKYIMPEDFEVTNDAERVTLKNTKIAFDHLEYRVKLSNNFVEGEFTVNSYIQYNNDRDIDISKTFDFDLTPIKNDYFNALMNNNNLSVSYMVHHKAGNKSHLVNDGFTVSWSANPSTSKAFQSKPMVINGMLEQE